MQTAKADIFKKLQADILRLNGFKSSNTISDDIGLGAMADSFPNGTFPLGTVHEFLSDRHEEAATASGFIAGLASSIIQGNGVATWISSTRTIFPPALKRFGIEPDQFIFIDLEKKKDVFWAIDEALKCDALSVVIGELSEIDFTSSRRLQLAVEQSQVTGFILRKKIRVLSTTAFVSRWRVTSSASAAGKLPGLGFPQWKVELLRMRNGKPGSWIMQWRDGRFYPVHQPTLVEQVHQKKAG